MPKYSLEEVLDIIGTLSPEEKSLLQARLSSMLTSSPTGGGSIQSQSQSLGDISISGGGNAFSNTQSGGNSNLTQSANQASVENADLQEALKLLEKLKHDISSNTYLNAVEKATVEVPIKVVEDELKKPEPNKDLIDQAISSLQKGLQGVVVLAEPVAKVAALVGRAWIGL